MMRQLLTATKGVTVALGALVLLSAVEAAAQPTTAASIWNPTRRPPLLQLQLLSPGIHKSSRTLIGIYERELLCYVESINVGAGDLRFARGSDVPLSEWREDLLSAMVQSIREQPADKIIFVIGHAEPTEVSREDAAITLSLRRAEAARRLLVAAGIAPERLRVQGHGTRESALLYEEVKRAERWRRVTLQFDDAPSTYGARLIRRDADQRALLSSIVLLQKSAAERPGSEPFEVGHHVSRLELHVDEAALARIKLPPPDPQHPPADADNLARLMLHLQLHDCARPAKSTP